MTTQEPIQTISQFGVAVTFLGKTDFWVSDWKGLVEYSGSLQTAKELNSLTR